MKTKIFPINVLELRRLIDKTNDARKLIKGQDVIFVIGNTGSGKSTNILKFLGYTLELGDYNGLETLIPVEKLHEAHKTFYTSPEEKSCTRYINSVAVPDNRQVLPLVFGESKHLLNCIIASFLPHFPHQCLQIYLGV